ncbi:ABC transporter ATP-binding protein [Sphingomonas sp.]|uniref:ABC transporter ATP-binding protein n=1 Tax=Sphingomonas sp. TaxID=28214 RepID=UPI003CC53952
MTALLRTVGLNKHFGGLHVTADVNLDVQPGEVHCLIGPNGAGKSTLFRLILGEHAPSSGQVLYAGQDVTPLRPHERVRRGMSVKFQVPGVFPSLTARHNLEIALQHHTDRGALAAETARLLELLGLQDVAGQPAGALSHGQKQWLEIGMAIALQPRLLLLDEPAAGLSPEETHATGELVQSLNRAGMTVLAVEHDMEFVRQVAHRVTVLHLGRIFAQGSMEEVVANEQVAAIYLGEQHD